MLGELNDIGSEDEAAKWAHRRLPDKNKLNADGCQAYRGGVPHQAVELRCAPLRAMPEPEPVAAGTPPDRSSGAELTAAANAGSGPRRRIAKPKPRPRAKSVDKAVLAHPEPRRIRDRDHVRFVAQQPCLICGRQPSDAHHLRFAQSRALGRKVSDEFTVPLCRGHHREVHRCGDEAAWWKVASVDPSGAARALWLETHPLPATTPRAFRTRHRVQRSPAIRPEDPSGLKASSIQSR